MAGQAGWYKAPGEDGLLRYWNGGAWTNHRQPVPGAITPPEPEAVGEDADPMAEYERQFDTLSPLDAGFDRPSSDFDSRPFDSAPTAPSTEVVVSAPQPQYRPQVAPTSAPIVPAPTPEFAGTSAAAPRSLGPIALGPATPTATPVVDAPESEFDRMYREMTALAGTPTPIALAEATPVTEPAVDAAPAQDGSPEQDADSGQLASPQQAEESAPPAAPVAVGIAPNRKAVLGAVRIMAAAIIVILIGGAAMIFFSLANNVSAGQVKTNAIVTSLGATSGNSCTPIARFAVAGRSYTANSSAAISPCPIGLGERVDVVYSAANPASAARIEVGTSATQYLWLVPILGGLVFVGGLITFILRAGSIPVGIALLRKTGEGPTEHEDTAEFAVPSSEHVN